MASAIGNLQNLCMYSLGPSLSGDVAESLESQITGLQNLQKNQVNQAISIDTKSMIAKTAGAKHSHYPGIFGHNANYPQTV